MSNTSFSWLPIVLISLIGFGINYGLIQSCNTYKKAKETLATELSYKKRFLNGQEWEPVQGSDDAPFDYKDGKLTVELAFGSSADQKKLLEEQQTAINTADTQVWYWMFAWLAWLGLFLGVCFWAYQRHPNLQQVLLGALVLSAVCLHAGLFTPMLEIGAIERDFDLGQIPIQKEVMGVQVDFTVQKRFEGDLYFYYQSKSVMELVWLLLKQGNLLVGLSIMIFSVLFPLIKTILMGVLLVNPALRDKPWFDQVIMNLGKWSMADVFVVAIFLGFLAFGNMQTGISTYSSMSVGLYFFFAYCILSIWSSSYVKKKWPLAANDIATSE